MCGADVLREHAQALLPLVVFPQIQLPPGLVLLRRLALEVTLAVLCPQLIRVLQKVLQDGWMDGETERQKQTDKPTEVDKERGGREQNSVRGYKE